MAKGFLRGVVWGTGVSLAAIMAVSVVDSVQNLRGSGSGTSAPLSRPGEVAQPAGRSGASGPSAAGRVVADVPGPEPDTLAGLLSETLAPAAVPQTGNATALAASQDASSDPVGGIVATLDQAPRVPDGGGARLQTPLTEPSITVLSEPAQPVAPVIETQSSAFAEPAAPVAPEPEPEPAATVDTGPATVEPTGEAAVPEPAQQPPSAKPAPQAFDAPRDVEGEGTVATAPTSGQNETDTAAQPATQIAALSPLSAAPEAPRVVSDAPQQPASRQPPGTAPEPMRAEPAAPEKVAMATDLAVPEKAAQGTEADDSAAAQVSAGLSVDSLDPTANPAEEAGNLAPQIAPGPQKQLPVPLPAPDAQEAALSSGVADVPARPPVAASEATQEATAPVRVNRLPSLGSADAEAPEVAAPEATPVEVPGGEVPPVERYAAAFENAENQPLMAVVLLDDGVDLSAPNSGLDALRSLPFAVSIAVPALLPDAPVRMETYRAAGFEVLAAVDLPQGALAGDAEVNIAAALDTLPQVIGILDGVQTGVQTTPDAGRQVAQILAQSGHGLITQNRGLNTVQKLAVRAGVPSAVVFRDFDAKGQTSTVIRRFLDQAAFRAGQEGAVVMLGRLREETIAALALWTLQDRAATVALAPASAAMRAAVN